MAKQQFWIAGSTDYKEYLTFIDATDSDSDQIATKLIQHPGSATVLVFHESVDFLHWS
jgi:hypothetical protein